ncbi:hypothetical protein [Ensifer sp. 4252]|uniref:hypothetical protein n=1 Tax=Ensifer sp. 4252 TaxID=3373915 RepID=UPI003D1EF1CB
MHMLDGLKAKKHAADRMVRVAAPRVLAFGTHGYAAASLPVANIAPDDRSGHRTTLQNELAAWNRHDGALQGSIPL